MSDVKSQKLMLVSLYFFPFYKIGVFCIMTYSYQLTTSQNVDVEINGVPPFKLDILAVKIIVNVSATLFMLSNQFINIVIELKVIKLVLPPAEAKMDIVQTISVVVQIDSVEATMNAGILYEPVG